MFRHCLVPRSPEAVDAAVISLMNDVEGFPLFDARRTVRAFLEYASELPRTLQICDGTMCIVEGDADEDGNVVALFAITAPKQQMLVARKLLSAHEAVKLLDWRYHCIYHRSIQIYWGVAIKELLECYDSIARETLAGQGLCTPEGCYIYAIRHAEHEEAAAIALTLTPLDDDDERMGWRNFLCTRYGLWEVHWLPEYGEYLWQSLVWLYGYPQYLAQRITRGDMAQEEFELEYTIVRLGNAYTQR